MYMQQLIINVFESKVFISLTSFIFGIFIYLFYLYIKELKSKYDFSDELRDIVNHYLKKGRISLSEYDALVRLIAHMRNYLGVYRKYVETMIKEFGENVGLNFSEGIFDEKENKENKPNDLDKLLKENLELKKRLSNLKNPLIVESIDDNGNDF